MNEEQDRATASTYEDEITSQRTVTIPLREYDELKSEQRFIKDKSLIFNPTTIEVFLSP